MHTVFAHSVHTCTHTMYTTSTYCLSHVSAWCACSVHGVHVLCMVCTFCVWCAGSVYGVQVLCIVCKFCAWCASSVHGVQVLCMFCAWCARSVHGCSLSISTSQARFQPLYIFMYMYIHRGGCLSFYYYYPTTSV